MTSVPAAVTVDDPLPATATVAAGQRLGVLDGWRAISILLVIAGHWLPFDIILPNLNMALPATGMAIFFTLSGFLITRFLLDRPEVGPFLIRRFLRILPLAWGMMIALFLVDLGNPGAIGRLAANLLFTANLPPAQLLPAGEHLWSLCVEMQFYVGIALLVGLGGRRALGLLPVLAVAVTVARIAAEKTVSIVTWHRLDEILVGATLALVFAGWCGARPGQILARFPLWLAVALAVLCCYFIETPAAYFRPYAVALMVGVTLYHCPRWLERLLTSRPAVYVAEISYALYVFHVVFAATWLGSGGTTEKYLKRPLLAAVTLAAAHVSTFYYERYFTNLGRRLTRSKPDKSGS